MEDRYNTRRKVLTRVDINNMPDALQSSKNSNYSDVNAGLMYCPFVGMVGNENNHSVDNAYSAVEMHERPITQVKPAVVLAASNRVVPQGFMAA